MNSALSLDQRDELHLFLAVTLHLAVGLLLYAIYVETSVRRTPITLEGLPIVFGNIVSPGGEVDEDVKTLSRSEPSAAQNVGAGRTAQQQTADAAQQRQSNTIETQRAAETEVAPAQRAQSQTVTDAQTVAGVEATTARPPPMCSW